MKTKFSKIVLATDIEDLLKFATIANFPLERWSGPPEEKPDDFELNPSYFYIFAFKAKTEMIPFMAAKAGAPNCLAFLCRPGSGYLSSENELGKITLLSENSLRMTAQEKIMEVLNPPD